MSIVAIICVAFLVLPIFLCLIFLACDIKEKIYPTICIMLCIAGLYCIGSKFLRMESKIIVVNTDSAITCENEQLHINGIPMFTNNQVPMYCKKQ